jgi:hypothetical protein
MPTRIDGAAPRTASAAPRIAEEVLRARRLLICSLCEMGPCGLQPAEMVR